MDHNKIREIISITKQEKKAKAKLAKDEKKGIALQIGTVINTNSYSLLDDEVRENERTKDFIVIGNNDTYHYVVDSNYNSCYGPIYKVNRTSSFKELGTVTDEHLKNALLSCRYYCISNPNYTDSSSFKLLRKALDY